MPFTLSENDNFGLVAVHMVYTDLKEEQTQLSDGKWVLAKVPFEIERTWQRWLGSIKADKLKEANLVVIRTRKSQTPRILDNEQAELGKDVTQLFYTLQLGGVLEYGAADNLKGSFYDGAVEIRQHGVLPQFYPSKGYSRTPVTIERLEEAAKLRAVLPIVYSGDGQFARFG